MKQRILILYTSVGLGHKYIADNINYYLQESGYETKMHDVFQLQEGWLVDFSISLHQFINKKLPWLWRWLYLSETFSYFTLPLRVPLAAGNSSKIKEVINEFQPQLIITTQTSASAAVAYLKRNNFYHGKMVVAFSDYHLHKYWLYDEADHYLVNIEDQIQEMEQLKVSRNKISLVGITLQPLKATSDNFSIKQRLGIDQSARVVLMGSGSLGTGMDLPLIERFADLLKKNQPDAQIVIVTGKNTEMKSKLEGLNKSNILALGFYEPMHELYQISELYLTKPGGLTTAECLQSEVPIVITHWLPGQEELNYNYLVANRLVSPVVNPLTPSVLCDTVVHYLKHKPLANKSLASQITQSNNEGNALIQAIKTVFHDV